MTTKRGPGRPRKPREAKRVRVTAHLVVPPFPAERPAKAVRRELAAAFRTYMVDDPKRIDPMRTFRTLMGQCADAIEAGDTNRLAYFALWAIRDSANHWQSEYADVLGTLHNLPGLTEIGKGKLHSDKRKGHRGNW
jgi:hypothetical protein